MKRIMAFIFAALLLVGTGITALADGEAPPAGWTVTTSINEAGNEVISATDEDGNVFSIEELPEFDDEYTHPEDVKASAASEMGAGKPVYAWAGAGLAVVVIGAAVYFVLKKKKQPQA